jgi:hypothetical protein
VVKPDPSPGATDLEVGKGREIGTDIGRRRRRRRGMLVGRRVEIDEQERTGTLNDANIGGMRIPILTRTKKDDIAPEDTDRLSDDAQGPHHAGRGSIGIDLGRGIDIPSRLDLIGSPIPIEVLTEILTGVQIVLWKS